MSDTKTCPYCGEEIKSVAIKCKHCGSLLTEAPVSGAITGITLIKQALSTRYELQEEIGKGGMATVYKAIQKNLQRPVALKVIHQNLIHDSEFVARFHREAQVCASLQHHNIVTVHDEGELNGVHFMAMELLIGNDLHQLIHRQGRLSVEQTLKWVTPIVEALSYAHHKGIIHRDIKSSNILITQSGRSVLMDFGIAHAASGTKLTQTGMVIGTPEYMSPEQAEGKSIDHRTDIYSLGIVLYECLTGHVPFKADNPLSIIMKVVNEAPVPPVEYNNQIPAWLNRTILQCLAKDPEDRFENAGALARALARAQAPVSKPAKKQSRVTPKPQAGSQQPPPDIRKSPPRKRKKGSGLKTFAWLLFILLLILAGVYGVNYYQQQQETAKAKRAEYALYSNALGYNTQQTYTQYLNTYPNGAHSYEVRQKLQALQEEQRKEERMVEERRRNDPFYGQMVYVAGGTFEMGSNNGNDDEKPIHTVTVNSFYIGKYEVTQKQWKAIMGNNLSHFKGDDLPVDNVSWDDAQEFIKKLNQKTGEHYRLPTEAEWEYAARGGNKSHGYKYSRSNDIDEVAWDRNNSGNHTHPVGIKPPNALGLYDMSGNVWEWCNDWYNKNYYSHSPQNNPQGPASGTSRVLRGGSWVDYAGSCRVALRYGFNPNPAVSNYGFRVVR